jgi:hypothetical protein
MRMHVETTGTPLPPAPETHGATSTMRDRVGEALDRVATPVGRALSSAADTLQPDAEGASEGLADRVAKALRTSGDYLIRADGDRIVEDAEDVARRRPGAVAAGALVVGFTTSRLLRRSGRS